MDEFKKLKRIYSGELLIFSVLFLVLGILFLTGVIAVADWKRWVFSILTLLGGAWLTVDFIWCLVSKKRRAKNAMIDKILAVLMAFPVLIFDILALSLGWVTSEEGVTYFRYVLGTALTYYGVVYLFEGIYHYYKPVPMLIEAYEADMAVKAKEGEDAADEEAQEETEEKDTPLLQEETQENTSTPPTE